jgi:hypothetical protein
MSSISACVVQQATAVRSVSGSVRSMTHDAVPTTRETMIRSCRVQRRQAAGLLRPVVQVLLLEQAS